MLEIRVNLDQLVNSKAFELQIVLYRTTMSDKIEAELASGEAIVTELYQLYSACKKRESSAVNKAIQELKRRNVKFKLIVGEGTTTLHLMSFHGNLGMVKLLVEMYGNAEAKDENQRTPLHLACMQGHLEIAQYLHYECGCSLQCEDKDGWTPIELAGIHDHIDIVKYFDAWDQSPIATEAQDLTTFFQGIKLLYQLFTAYKNRDSRLVAESNSHLCVMNVKFVLRSENCFTALHFLCKLGILEGVKYFIEMYGNVEARDESGRTPLHIACKNGHIDVSEYLILECGCDKEAIDNEQNTPLFTACWNNQTAMVKHLVSRFGCKSDIRDTKGLTPLHITCAKGYTDITEYLINQCGCDKEDRNNELQFTPLFYACLTGQADTVKLLVSKFRCNLDITDDKKCTPLHAACFSGYQQLFLYLINECGFSPEVTDVAKQWTPLHFACSGGHLEIIKHLVTKCGCDIEARDIRQRTPLHIACGNGHIDTAEYLINQCGCDKEATDNDLRTPLMLACAEGKTSTVKCLISRFQCKFDIKDFRKHSPLHIACYFGHQKLVKYFINDCGYSPEDSDETELLTPLHIACAGGNLETIKYLVNDCNCDVKAKSKDKYTPLHVACASGSIDAIEYLIIQCGCDREARDSKQYTPLFSACVEGQTSTVKCLISKFGCKLDVRNIKGETPLHIACINGFLELVQYLINECGCSPEVTDETSQRTSFHHACHGGHLEIIKYLANECKCNTEARDKLDYTPLYLVSCVVPNSSGGSDIYTEVVPYLILELGCDPEAETLDGSTPMKNFYRFGQLSLIKHCINLKKHNPRTWKSYLRPSPPKNSTEQPDSFYRTQSSTYISRSPLQVSCAVQGSMEVVKFLVEEYGYDPMEGTELVGANNTEELAQLLELAQMVIPFPDSIEVEEIPAIISQNYPLDQACYSGRLDMLQYLIDKCRQAFSLYHCHRLMITASKYGRSEIMRYLLNFSTPDVEDSQGDTLLHIATTAKDLKGAYETVKILIGSMANLDLRNYLGETALHTACKLHPCRPDIIELLLSSGCNSQISNFAGKTSLWMTQSSDVFKIFMRYSPADVCERILSDDIDEEQSLELLECLIQQYNWNPNDTTKNGDTALHLACKADRLTMVKYLFSINTFKYDPYAKNKLNQSPIELTSSKEMIRELIKHGNPIDLLINPVMDEEQILQLVREIDNEKLNGTTANDNTALHLACLTDRTTIVRYLLRECKIDVNAKNVIDISPIQLTKNSEIIIELIRHGANPTDLYSYC